MNKKLMGAILIVAGVAIGSGMLGMPIITGFAGFVPSLGAMICTCAFSLFAGFLIVDISLSFNNEVNIISMAEKTLGKTGKIFSWIAFLFLLYALDIAFISAGGKILGNLFPQVSPLFFPVMIALPLGWIIFRGISAIDKVNRILVLGKLLLGYGILVCFVPSHVQASLLTHVDFFILPLALPTVVQAFGFHLVIPSLVSYLDRNRSQLRIALSVGSLIGLIVYGIWEWLVLGTVPITGEVSLAYAFVHGDVVTTPLIHLLQNPLIATGATIFALCSVGTAFLGVTMSLFDFLIDGLKLQKDPKGRWKAGLLTFTPPLFFVYLSPSLFLEALHYAGALIALISGILPICMAWKLNAGSAEKNGTRRILFLAGGLFFSLIIVFDLLGQCGYLTHLLEPYLKSSPF